MSFTLPENLPSIRDAKLPEMYLAAKKALAACDRIDECKDWADKSAAMASYAKMAADEGLLNYAARVRARAIRRCGELLQTYEAKPGTRTDKQPPAVTGTRFRAAAEAGLSERKRNTALRLASIPAADFDAAIEADHPPSITALAAQGTVKKYLTPAETIGNRDPKDFQAATHALGALRRFVDMTQQYDPAAIVRGCDAREGTELLTFLSHMTPWIEALTLALGAQNDGTPKGQRTADTRAY